MARTAFRVAHRNGNTRGPFSVTAMVEQLPPLAAYKTCRLLTDDPDGRAGRRRLRPGVGYRDSRSLPRHDRSSRSRVSRQTPPQHPHPRQRRPLSRRRSSPYGLHALHPSRSRGFAGQKTGTGAFLSSLPMQPRHMIMQIHQIHHRDRSDQRGDPIRGGGHRGTFGVHGSTFNAYSGSLTCTLETNQTSWVEATANGQRVSGVLSKNSADGSTSLRTSEDCRVVALAKADSSLAPWLPLTGPQPITIPSLSIRIARTKAAAHQTAA